MSHALGTTLIPVAVWMVNMYLNTQMFLIAALTPREELGLIKSTDAVPTLGLRGRNLQRFCGFRMIKINFLFNGHPNSVS